MKLLGITQRVDNVIEYNERRDCLDQRLAQLANSLGFYPVPLPNISTIDMIDYFNRLNLDAIILSGGNDIGYFGLSDKNIAKERDKFEYELIKYSIANYIPIIGICRGMQMINYFFGGRLKSIKGHVKVKHQIYIKPELHGKLPTTVTCYHTYAIDQDSLPTELIPLAWDVENNVEAFIHKDNPIGGVMWHPERESPIRKEDVQFIKSILR